MAAKTIIFTFLICQFVINISFGQDWCDTVIANIKGKRLLSEIQPEVQVIKDNELDFFDRKTEFGVETVSGVCTPKNPTILNNGCNYLITIHSKNDTIFLFDVAEYRDPIFGFKATKKFTQIDKAIVNAVLTLHNAKYSSSWKIKDYFKGLDTSKNFQSAAGILAYPKSPNEFLSALVKARDHQALINFASSLHPEIRTFGTIGLFLLKLDGEKLTALEEKLIAINQNSNIMVSGMQLSMGIYGLSTETKMSDLLNSDRLKDFYLNYDKSF